MEKATRNQLGNVNNVYQSDAKRVLCICSAGMLRSPSIANVLHKEFGFNTRAAGTEDYALIPVSEVLLAWAEEIVFVDNTRKHVVISDLKRSGLEHHIEDVNKKSIVLAIPDRYNWMDLELQTIILEKYNAAHPPEKILD